MGRRAGERAAVGQKSEEHLEAEIDLVSLSWEAAISWVGDSDEAAASLLTDFYGPCMGFN